MNQDPNQPNQVPVNATTPAAASAPKPATNHKPKIAIILVVLIVVVIGLVLIFHTKKTTPNTLSKLAPAKVSITATGFVPSTISVKVGQTVAWTNNDTASHEVAADPYPTDNGIPGFNSKTVLLKGDSLDFVFSKVGTYTYHDQLNPKTEGTVEVEKD